MLESIRLGFHIVRRNWWVYQKDFIANISPTIADPAFLLLTLGAGLGTYMAHVEGHSYSEYLAPGLAVGTAMFTAFFETSYGFFVRLTFENIFKAMLTTPIGVTEIVLGEFIWVGLKGALMISFVTLFLALFGLFKNPLLFPLVPVVGMFVALPLGAMGLLSTCWVKNINQFQTVYAFLISPIYFFSGVFFPIAQMPEGLQWLATISPLYHGVKLAQAVFWDQGVVQAFSLNGPILVLYSGALLFWAHRQVRKKLQT